MGPMGGFFDVVSQEQGWRVLSIGGLQEKSQAVVVLIQESTNPGLGVNGGC